VGETFSEWLPLSMFEAAEALLKADPFDGTEAEPMRPFEFIDFAAGQHANSHQPYVR